MIRYRHVIAVGLLALCSCAVGPAVAQTPTAETQPARVSESQEAAALSDRVSRVEGRLEGMEAASTQAAAASAEASRSAQGVIEQVGTSTKLVTLVIAIVGGLLGFFGYRELKGIQTVREEATTAVRDAERAREKAEDAVKKAAACAASAETSLANVEREMEASRQRAGALVGQTEESAKKAENVLEKINDLHRRAAQVDPTKELTDEEKEILEDASKASELLEDLGQELTPEAYVARGIDQAFGGDYERSVVEYNRAIQLRDGYARAHHSRGVSLARLGRYEEALAAYDRALELNPNDAPTHYNRGITLGYLGKYKEGASACDRAIELEPGRASAYYNRACAHARLDNKEKALLDLTKAIELDETCRKEARDDKDDDFASLRDDPEFRKLVGPEEEEGEGS
ncbi:MAG: tetratricopeptide repeat protein [Proteobacteria bacterium]|nr:tetratricopeptide repeat protein [Pseudomonadota bacterium]